MNDEEMYSMDRNESWYPSPRYLLRKKLIIKCLQRIKCKGKSIIEIGYGAGDGLCTYSKLGMKVYGYDYSDIAFEEASKRLLENGIDNVKLFNNEKDAYLEKYDVVLACEVLEHIEDDNQMLKRWYDALNKKGHLIFSVPAKMSKWCLNDEWAGHYRRYEKSEIKNQLNECGFDVIWVWSYPVPINIVLDYLLEKEKKSNGGIEYHESNNYSIDDKTKESGIKREAGKLARALSKNWFIAPWHFLQLLFLNSDLGSGYVVMAKRIEE